MTIEKPIVSGPETVRCPDPNLESGADSVTTLIKEAIKLRTLRLATTIMLLAMISLTLSGCLGNLFGPIETYTVSGTVVDSASQPIQGVQIVYTGGRSGSTVTGNDGSFTITGLVGSITITPVSSSYTFSPSNRTVSGQTSSANFVGTPDHEGHIEGLAEDFVTRYIRGTLATLEDHLASSVDWKWTVINPDTGVSTGHTDNNRTPQQIDDDHYDLYLDGLASAFATSQVSTNVTNTTSVVVGDAGAVVVTVSVTLAGNALGLGTESVDLAFARTDDGTALGDWRIVEVVFDDIFGNVFTDMGRASTAIHDHVIPLINEFGDSMEWSEAATNASLYFSGSSIQTDNSGLTVMTNNQILQAVQNELAQRSYLKYEITPSSYHFNLLRLMGIEAMYVPFTRTYQTVGGPEVVETGSFTLVNVAGGTGHDWKILTLRIDGDIR